MDQKRLPIVTGLVRKKVEAKHHCLTFKTIGNGRYRCNQTGHVLRQSQIESYRCQFHRPRRLSKIGFKVLLLGDPHAQKARRLPSWLLRAGGLTGNWFECPKCFSEFRHEGAATHSCPRCQTKLRFD